MSRSQNIKSYGRGKHSNHPNTVVHSSIQFDKFFCENSNKPTAAKSAGTVGKWGITSFTSIRSSGFSVGTKETSRFSSLGKKRQQAVAESAIQIKRPVLNNNIKRECSPVVERKFFKSRNAAGDGSNQKNYSSESSGKKASRHRSDENKKKHSVLHEENKNVSVKVEKPIKIAKKVVSPKIPGDDISLLDDFNKFQTLPSPPKERDKPPIVLRIFKGTSQLIDPVSKTETDDESEPELKNPAPTIPPVEPNPTPVSPKTISIKSKRRSPEKSLSPEPKRRNSEKSLSPDAPRTRRRSPERSQSPEPAKTTRSLRRRGDAVPQPHTSPKRALRSTRNASATGKIVIANLNSDHPTVYTVPEEIATVPTSPKRKDSKECRSYSNKHKYKSKEVKEPEAVKKVEELLADLEETSEPLEKIPEPMDTDRAELLQLLEDDEEPAAPAPIETEIKPEESDLKIRIKLTEIVKPDPEPVEPEPPIVFDSQDSGIGIKSEEVYEEKPQIAELSDNSVGAFDSSEFELKSESGPSIPAVNKKGSIFKHRSSNDGNKKRLALYKHKWADDKDVANNAEDDKNANTGLTKSKALDSIFDSELDEMPLTKFIKQSSTDNFDFEEPTPVTGVKCSKKNKEFYTVVRNVKKAHQIQESGEFQEFNDDVEYILDALQDNNPIGTRCLSAITLATKCTEPAFRMHVRAHGTVTKFFRTLHDATKDQSLGLCTATVMFVLSQDRLNMDLDRDSLELMLNLLESDASHTKALEDCGLTDSQLTKTRDRVRQICEDIQAQGHAKHLNLDNITVGHLSMETLLSLTSKRAGEWFKEELRELGGLEHIIKTVVECCKHVDDTANAWSTTSLDKIRKVDRCLRVLENVTMQNEQNINYLLEYQDGILIDTLIRMYRVCDYEIPLYPTDSINDKDSTGAVLRECLIANLKVLINITHDYETNSQGAAIIGRTPGVIESSLHVLLQVPQYIPKEEKFDLMLLTLILLINLVEHCDSNRKAILDAKAPSDEENIFETRAREPAVKALIAMFYNHEELARNEEKKTDAILEGENAEKPPNSASQKVHEDFIEETISMLVQKAGQNMEHTLIAAYVAMLIGYLITKNEDHEKLVRNHLPEKNFQFMVSVLQKFYSFMTLTASGGTVSNKGMKSVQKVIQQLIDSDTRFGISGEPSTSAQSSNDEALNLNVTSNSGDKNYGSLQNKFCESQNNVNLAISAS